MDQTISKEIIQEAITKYFGKYKPEIALVSLAIFLIAYIFESLFEENHVLILTRISTALFFIASMIKDRPIIKKRKTKRNKTVALPLNKPKQKYPKSSIDY